jgi:UDP:flavonoid glycosyltransferase YjiC (YdhE family)
MKKFLFATLPSNDLGLLAQSLPIARELKRRGQDIAFCSPGKAPRKVIDAAGFENLHLRYAPFLPGLAMAERSDLVIHHGGYGSCQTGHYAGTPAVIIPTYSERESNARRVAGTGAGDFVLPAADGSGRNKKVDRGQLRAKIERVLSDPSFKENAKRISEKMRAFGGAAEAAHMIENHILGADGKNKRP